MGRERRKLEVGVVWQVWMTLWNWFRLLRNLRPGCAVTDYCQHNCVVPATASAFLLDRPHGRYGYQIYRAGNWELANTHWKYVRIRCASSEASDAVESHRQGCDIGVGYGLVKALPLNAPAGNAAPTVRAEIGRKFEGVALAGKSMEADHGVVIGDAECLYFKIADDRQALRRTSSDKDDIA